MALAELITLENTLQLGIIDALTDKTVNTKAAEVLKRCKSQDIVPTEAREHVPEVYGGATSTLIQVEKPASNFDTPERSVYHEYPECITRINCYKRIPNWKAGVTLVGKGRDKGLNELAGAVAYALTNKQINRSHIACLVNIEDTDPIIEVNGGKPTGAIACVTVIFKHRFAINIAS